MIFKKNCYFSLRINERMIQAFINDDGQVSTGSSGWSNVDKYKKNKVIKYNEKCSEHNPNAFSKK